MKKNILLSMSVLMLFLFGCGAGGSSQIGIERVPDVESVAVLTEIAALNIGCEVAKFDDQRVDRALRNIYESIEQGGLTRDATLQLAQLTKKNPTIAPSIAKLTKLYRINLRIDFENDAADQALAVATDPKVYQAIGAGYAEGFVLCGPKLE